MLGTAHKTITGTQRPNEFLYVLEAFLVNFFLVKKSSGSLVVSKIPGSFFLSHPKVLAILMGLVRFEDNEKTCFHYKICGEVFRYIRVPIEISRKY